MNDWKRITEHQPPIGSTVETKIDGDGKGERNVQTLTRRGKYGNLWFYPDGSMYVYYRPTHYRELK